MDIFLQIIISGITLGALYAVGTIALSLLWGTMGMMNLAHGAFIALGGYAAYWCMSVLGANWIKIQRSKGEPALVSFKSWRLPSLWRTPGSRPANETTASSR